MKTGHNNKEVCLFGAPPINHIFDPLDYMDDSEVSLVELGCTYQDIGHALLDTLFDEHEPLADFLIDWHDYVLCLRHDIDMIAKLGWGVIQRTPEYKQILKTAHSFALECQRSRYIETGIDCHLSLTISEFLAEIFKRYHCSIN